MESVRRKLVSVLLTFFLLSCLRNPDNASSKLDGHWYAVYGDSRQLYGEAIYKDGHACFYSDYFGLRYRTYKIKSDSILEIYDRQMLDNKCKLSFSNLNAMQQTLVSYEPINVVNGVVNYYKVADAGISYEKLFALDTAEQNKFITGFMLRKAQWEIKK